MTDNDARWRGAARFIRQTLRDVLHFAAWPTMPETPRPGGRRWAATLAVVFALDCAVALAFIGAFAGLETFGLVLPEMEELGWSFWETAVFAVLLMPVLEEAFFRGWLSGRRPALIFAASAVISVVMLGVVAETDGAAPAMGWSAILPIVAGGAWWLVRLGTISTPPRWFSRYFHLVVWGSTLSFGVIHVTNFAVESGWLALVAVLPQTLGGLVLAYTRTRLGLRAAMLQHIAFNGMVMTIWGI